MNNIIKIFINLFGYQTTNRRSTRSSTKVATPTSATENDSKKFTPSSPPHGRGCPPGGCTSSRCASPVAHMDSQIVF